MSTKMKDDRHMTSQMLTTDPHPGLPALTTLLYKVCDHDDKNFDEACRLLDLFMDKAQERK